VDVWEDSFQNFRVHRVPPMPGALGAPGPKLGGLWSSLVARSVTVRNIPVAGQHAHETPRRPMLSSSEYVPHSLHALMCSLDLLQGFIPLEPRFNERLPGSRRQSTLDLASSFPLQILEALHVVHRQGLQ